MAFKLLTASFAGILIPVVDVTVQGGQRYHVHEYPHAPGGEPEKMGRKLYMIRFAAWFHDLTDEPEAAALFPDLWPNGLKELCRKLEEGTTEDLVVPTVGTIKAFPTAWTRKWVASQALNGEKVDLEFCEDSADVNLAGTEYEFGSESVIAANDDLQATAELAKYLDADGKKPSLLDQINGAVDAFKAARDSAGIATSLISAKLEAISSLCRAMESELDPAGDPSMIELSVAGRDLWHAATKTAASLLAPEKRVLVYVVPARTNIMALSQQLHGDTEHVGELLKLNAFPDAYVIAAGTEVSYLVAA